MRSQRLENSAKILHEISNFYADYCRMRQKLIGMKENARKCAHEINSIQVKSFGFDVFFLSANFFDDELFHICSLLTFYSDSIFEHVKICANFAVHSTPMFSFSFLAYMYSSSEFY